MLLEIRDILAENLKANSPARLSIGIIRDKFEADGAKCVYKRRLDRSQSSTKHTNEERLPGVFDNGLTRYDLKK